MWNAFNLHKNLICCCVTQRAHIAESRIGETLFSHSHTHTLPYANRHLFEWHFSHSENTLDCLMRNMFSLGFLSISIACGVCRAPFPLTVWMVHPPKSLMQGNLAKEKPKSLNTVQICFVYLKGYEGKHYFIVESNSTNIADETIFSALWG